MARTFTLAELTTRLEQMTDTESDSHLGANEKYAIIASACAETWDKVIAAGLADQYVKSVTFSTTAGTQTYAWGTVISAGDFYKVHSLAVLEGSKYRILDKVNPSETFSYQAPSAVYSLKLHYIPCAPTFKSGGSFSTGLTFDGISGWEEHALCTAAITVKAKKEDDYSAYARRKAELEERISRMANTDWGEPARVSRRRCKPVYPYAGIQSLTGWLPRGANLELFESSLYP